MTTSGLEIHCPYCNCVFETGKPLRPISGGTKKPIEVECLPYTRDIGRFDPKSARERTSPGGWTQVCKDFMPFLGFQRIGILRKEADKALDVMYRVQYCHACKRLFDIYANYTSDRKLEQIWPHLFAPDSESPEKIERYNGISWPIWIVENMACWLRLPKREHGAILMGFLIFLIGFLPWLVYYLRIRNGEETRILWMTLITYAVAATSVTTLMLMLMHFVRKMQLDDDFYTLFRTNNTNGVSYWYNYTLCRFVGVQTKGHFPQISQVEVWGSGLALISLVLVWAITHTGQINFLVSMSAILAFVGLVWLFRRLFKKSTMRGFKSIISALLVLFLFLLLVSSDRAGVLRMVGEVIFWSVFAYITGMAAWVGMSSTMYVLKGLTRIPMQISPLTQFKELKPLLGIQHYSTSVMAVLFITLVSLVFLIEMFADTLPHLFWMIYWVQIALAVLFAAIAVGFRPVFLFITAVYLALTAYIYSITALPTVWGIGLNLIQLNLIIFGGFLTFIMYFHLHEGRASIDKIVANEKEEVLEDIDGQINRLRSYTSLISGNEPHTKDKNQFFEYTQGLHGLDALLNLRKTVQVAQFRSINFAARVIGPLLWSIVLPSIWDLFTRFFIERWIQ